MSRETKSNSPQSTARSPQSPFRHAEPVPRWLTRMEARIAAGRPEPKRSRKTLLERK